MVVQRFALSPFFFHDPRARSGVGQGPIEYPFLEKLVEKILKPLGQLVPARSGVKAADAVEDFPDGDGGKTDPVLSNRIEKPGDARLRVRPPSSPRRHSCQAAKRPARSRLALVGELDRPVAMALGRWQLEPVLWAEISLEGLGRFRAAFGLLALFTNEAADEPFHRNADMPRFALEPGFIPRIYITDGEWWNSSWRLLVSVCRSTRSTHASRMCHQKKDV